MTELTVTALAAGYQGKPVLRGVDLHVPAGELAAVLGPSGCGKTTLLRVLAGLHRATAGQVLLGDRVVTGGGSVHVPPERRRIGLVPQEGALFPHLTVAGNVGFGLPRSADRSRRVAELLELVGLGGLERRMPAELSGGQQQRVALARALAPRPAVVLMDEPFSSLDAGLRAGLRADVRAALHAAGATAVLVTHDQEEALGCADLVAVLRDGRIAQVDTPQELYSDPVDLGVATFVGEAITLGGTASGSSVDTALGPLRLAKPAHGTGVAVLRPEQLVLAPTRDGANGSGVPARVVDVLFHGHDATVLLELAGMGAAQPVRSRVQGRVPARPDDTVVVTVDGDARFFMT